MWQFLLEGTLTIGGIIIGGQAIKLVLKWIKYGAKKMSPPDEKVEKIKEEMKNYKV